jgi:hypothetical protein
MSDDRICDKFVLLIETFRKFISPQNYGHQGSILGGLFLSDKSFMTGPNIRHDKYFFIKLENDGFLM